MRCGERFSPHVPHETTRAAPSRIKLIERRAQLRLCRLLVARRLAVRLPRLLARLHRRRVIGEGALKRAGLRELGCRLLRRLGLAPLQLSRVDQVGRPLLERRLGERRCKGCK